MCEKNLYSFVDSVHSIAMDHLSYEHKGRKDRTPAPALSTEPTIIATEPTFLPPNSLKAPYL